MTDFNMLALYTWTLRFRPDIVKLIPIGSDWKYVRKVFVKELNIEPLDDKIDFINKAMHALEGDYSE